jgi:rare lipoprotein A
MKFSLKFIIAFLYAFPGILSGSVNFYQDNSTTGIVRINDRLPKNSSRIIDLSKVAASELDFIKQGLTKVSIEVISEKPEPEQDLH